MAEWLAAFSAGLSSCVCDSQFSRFLWQVSVWLRLRQDVPPLLPRTNTDLHSSTQDVPKLELGKLGKIVLQFSFILISGLLLPQLSHKEAYKPIIFGFLVSSAVLYNGVAFRATNPIFGNVLILTGMSLILCFFCYLAGILLAPGFSYACWVCAVFYLLPSICSLFKPHPAPYWQRFRG